MSSIFTAIQMNPGLASAYNSRGLIKYNKGDHAGALPDYDKAIELDPQFAVAYVNRGEVKRASRTGTALWPTSGPRHRNQSSKRGSF